MSQVAAAHPDRRIELWFEDEARVGQKGRTTHRWWLRGQRPSGLCDKRFTSAYLFAAVEPATGAEVALVLPTVSTAAMSRFLAELSTQIAPDTHAVLVLDQAGWHGARALVVPPNLTLVPLPPYSPELNPVERLWLYLRERYLSHRLLEDYGAVVDACCAAWTALIQEPGRIQSLTSYPWPPCLNS
ncbi:IS630 family transposase [Rubellimicrobium mesophilum]|uniref:IS630 family transposase n=1 Tax=Rubellimicrobium mesophilum TaxID=1123067 RepID=UPI000686691D|nr:IS630 family transposase [Rubellimicrobium mesophilum]